VSIDGTVLPKALFLFPETGKGCILKHYFTAGLPDNPEHQSQLSVQESHFKRV
jgi:hypothetical protein